MKTAAILYGRNDGYKEDDRLTICMNSLLETFDEIWYIDWNSPIDEGSSLWRIKDRLSHNKKIKHIIIPPNIVSQMVPPEASVVPSPIPINIALRRTTADWIAVTTIDIIAPNKNTLDSFIKKSDSNTFYTISRRDIEYQNVIDFGIDNWKEYRDFLTP